MRTIALSGWGQPPDALNGVAPEATCVDYARCNGIKNALATIAREGRGHEVIIGWSLGGQLAVRAIAAGMIKPRFLVLIATPFQFVATKNDALGMMRLSYEKFRDNFERNSRRTMQKAWQLVLQGESRAEAVQAQLKRQSMDAVLTRDWLRWLVALDGFSCDSLKLDDFPSTLLIHGDSDVVVEVEQSQRFHQAIPRSRIAIMPGCGHAPHWHDPAAVKQLIMDHTHG
jgi:pimeloyl-[acyl-carrier protein] methyl ester esterase